MSELVITTNNVPRELIYGYELTEAERNEFNYYDWDKIEEGLESEPQFFRYKGQLYDLDEFMSDWGITKGSGLPNELDKWDAYSSDSFFSGIVIRWPRMDYNPEELDTDRIIVGWYYVKG